MPGESDLPPLTDGVFPWFNDGWAHSWPAGLLVLSAGLVGALATAYLTDPELLPELGGASELRSTRQQLDMARETWRIELSRRRSLAPGSGDDRLAAARLCDQLERQVAHWDATFRMQRRALVLRGVPLFVLLGGLLACLVSRSIVQALIVGAAWPAALQALGVPRRQADARSEAEETTRIGLDAAAQLRACRAARRDLAKQLNEARTALFHLTRSASTDPAASTQPPTH